MRSSLAMDGVSAPPPRSPTRHRHPPITPKACTVSRADCTARCMASSTIFYPVLYFAVFDVLEKYGTLYYIDGPTHLCVHGDKTNNPTKQPAKAENRRVHNGRRYYCMNISGDAKRRITPTCYALLLGVPVQKAPRVHERAETMVEQGRPFCYPRLQL